MRLPDHRARRDGPIGRVNETSTVAPRPTGWTSGSLRGVLGACLAAVVFAAATPWVLRPWFLASDTFPRSAGSTGAMVDADLFLNVWILGWIAHAILHTPAHLFDGNIFYPARDAIIGSENMLAHVPVTVPVLAATGSALAVLKAMALESFVLAGVGMFLLVYYHTRCLTAGLVAGACYTFTPFRAETIPEPQYLGTQYLPLALLAVDMWLDRGRVRALIGLAAALAMQALACVYVGFFTFLLVPVYFVARLWARPAGARRRRVLGVVAAFAAGGLAVIPTALPYLHGRATGAIPAGNMVVVQAFSWPPWMYVTPAVFHKAGLIAPVVLLLDVVARLLQRPRGAIRPRFGPETATWVLLGGAVLFSSGPYLVTPAGNPIVPLPYLFFYNYLPGFSTIRSPIRFFVVVAAAASALAGYAFARWTAKLPSVARLAGAGMLVVGCLWYAAPSSTVTMPAALGAGAPEVYRWLAQQPTDGAVLEIPGLEGDVVGDLRNARYVVSSTIHWRPLVNGYTGYPPPTASLVFALSRRLPDPDAFAILVDLVDIRWIVVHRNALSRADARRWSDLHLPGLTAVGRFGDSDVYAVSPSAERIPRDALLARAEAPQRTTLAGTPLAPLAPECRAARILDVTPPPVLFSTPMPQLFGVRFENASPCPWPGLEVRPEHLVGFRYRLVSPSGEVFSSPLLGRLMRDVPPHTVVEDSVLVSPATGEPGTWTCELSLVQDGVAEPLASRSVTLEQRRLRPSGAGAPRNG
jgi:hypothetical protein